MIIAGAGMNIEFLTPAGASEFLIYFFKNNENFRRRIFALPIFSQRD